MPIGIAPPSTTKKYQVTLICDPTVFPQLRQSSYINLVMGQGDSTVTLDRFAFTGGSIIDHFTARASGSFKNSLVFHRAPAQVIGEISGALQSATFTLTINAILDQGGVFVLNLLTMDATWYPTNMVNFPTQFLRITWDTSGNFNVLTAQGNGTIGSNGPSDAGFSVRVTALDAVAAGAGA